MRLAGQAQQDETGLAGRIARTLINTPVTPMLSIGALCIGLLGLLFAPRQEDPKILVQMIDIFVQYPRASAPQVESLVTEPIAPSAVVGSRSSSAKAAPAPPRPP